MIVDDTTEGTGKERKHSRIIRTVLITILCAIPNVVLIILIIHSNNTVNNIFYGAGMALVSVLWLIFLCMINKR